MDNDVCWLAIVSVDTDDAAFPQLFLMYVTTAATWESLSRQANAGMARLRDSVGFTWLAFGTMAAAALAALITLLQGK